MAQELEKVNVSKTEKNEFFCTKIFFSKFQFLAKSSFLKKSCPIPKPTPYTSTASSYATNPNNILLLLQAPRSGPHEVRNSREAAVPEKETNILLWRN